MARTAAKTGARVAYAGTASETGVSTTSNVFDSVFIRARGLKIYGTRRIQSQTVGN